MDQGEFIDKMVADMYILAQDSKYGFARFVSSWGRSGSEVYNDKLTNFIRTLRIFAKDCGIKSYNDDFYYFNGKVYEKVGKVAVCQAYDILMEQLGIASIMMNRSVRNEVFLKTILTFCQLKPRRDLQCFSNVVVDLKKCGKKDVKCTHRFDKAWPVIEYHNYPFKPDAKAPIFKRFLNQVLPDKTQRSILQMFLGLGLIQNVDAVEEMLSRPRGTVDLCLVLLGSGANGKSVLFNIVCALFGKSHVTSLDYDTIASDGDEGLRGRAAIRSATFNWSSDSDARTFAKKNNGVFKEICSGEDYTYRLLRHDIQHSKSCPYLVFSFNQLPTITEDGGMLRRLQFVNFDVTIPRFKQDPLLAYKIIKNELPGVFQWVLRGSMEIRRRHFMFPSSDASLKAKVRGLLPASPVYSWMLAYSLRSEPNAPTEIAAIIKSDVMYQCFKNFMENNNQQPIPTFNSFSRALTNLRFQRKRMADGVYYTCYGCVEDQLRTPVLLELLHEPDDVSSRYDKDKDSFIKDD